MSIARHHAEWLSLLETSGPFLSMPVLLEAFPQGLEPHDSDHHRMMRLGHDEWEDKRDQPATHAAWIKFVLTHSLDFSAQVLAEGQAVPQALQAVMPEHDGECLKPNFVLHHRGEPNKPRLLIQTYPHTQDLSRPVAGLPWKASPDTRMAHLLHATGVRLGLVTNGERWMLVNAPRGETTGFASWYATLWLEEPITFRTFRTLLGVQRFFGVKDEDTPEQLLARSAANQQEVTDQLGYQVRKAVEVLIQSINRADQDHERELLRNVGVTELYEASLTVMMRLVFLFCAEERGLLLLGDKLYNHNYAVSTLWEQLQATADNWSESVLEFRHDAWGRLLAMFRVVFGGARHEDLILPAYGGHLFDPERFPFLEGRKPGTSWRDTEAKPLPVDNRTVLHLLGSLQTLETKLPGDREVVRRRLSFRSLDIEQIGHVYEGLLDHTARRATEPHLGLTGTKNKEPEVPLAELEAQKDKGEKELLTFLKEATGKSEPALKKLLAVELDAQKISRFRAVCQGDDPLWRRVQPFAGLVRMDSFGYPAVIPTGSVYVTEGTARRSSGTHYTPRSLTEPIVQYTLEPLVYVGPAEGLPRKEWKLKLAKQLLDLKICDMACGSGAFLVQACRYLAERLQEAWAQEEKRTTGQPRVAPEGMPSLGSVKERVLEDDRARQIEALRLVAQRCLYGVDKNSLAVEMAKLSLWLLTLAKDRPFEFLDHAVRCGDSLIGIRDLKQLERFNLDGEGATNSLFLDFLRNRIPEAIELRRRIETMPANTVDEVEQQERLLSEAEDKLERLKLAADLLVAAELVPGSARDRLTARDDHGIKVAAHYHDDDLTVFRREGQKALAGLAAFHWALEFPEVFVGRGGFDAMIGNPPFVTGTSISTILGVQYKTYLKTLWPHFGSRADLCVAFFLRVSGLIREGGAAGLIGTDTTSEGDSRVTGPGYLLQNGFPIYRAVKRQKWPGAAAVKICHCHFRRGIWNGVFILDGESVDGIDSAFDAATQLSEPHQLHHSCSMSFTGTKVYGNGFVLSEEQGRLMLAADSIYRHVVKPYYVGRELNEVHCKPGRYIIDFTDMSKQTAQGYPLAWSVVDQRVRQKRQSAPEPRMREFFWQFQRPRKELYALLKKRGDAWLIAATSDTVAFIPVEYSDENPVVFSHAVNVLALESYGQFAVVQSTLHLAWARRYGSSMKGDMRYTTTDCFETFPFPNDCSPLVTLGQRYYRLRQETAQTQVIGLTDLYQLLHSQTEDSEPFVRLREAHAEMDRAVASAYGWADLDLGHDFHQTKQGLRFTICEIARREVLARLLKLNHERYAEEVRLGLHEKKKTASTKKSAKAKAKATSDEPSSLPFGEDE